MIRFLNDETVGGYRYGKGVLAWFDPETEAELLAAADAENYPLANSDFAVVLAGNQNFRKQFG